MFEEDDEEIQGEKKWIVGGSSLAIDIGVDLVCCSMYGGLSEVWMCWICVLLMHVGPLKSYILALRGTSQASKGTARLV